MKAARSVECWEWSETGSPSRLVPQTRQGFAALAGFTKMIPNAHILFGSDYLGTAGSAGNVVRGLESFDGFTPQQLRAVYRDNALQLLPRLRS